MSDINEEITNSGSSSFNSSSQSQPSNLEENETVTASPENDNTIDSRIEEIGKIIFCGDYSYRRKL